MIHNGEEACNAKRLDFFEWDPINWSKGDDCRYGQLLADLIAFRIDNPALHNGRWGALMQQVVNDRYEQLFAWVRQRDGNKVFGLLDFSREPVETTLADGPAAGTYREFRTGEAVTVAEGDTVTFSARGTTSFRAVRQTRRLRKDHPK